jgi:hypothetical protein
MALSTQSIVATERSRATSTATCCCESPRLAALPPAVCGTQMNVQDAGHGAQWLSRLNRLRLVNPLAPLVHPVQ